MRLADPNEEFSLKCAQICNVGDQSTKQSCTVYLKNECKVKDLELEGQKSLGVLCKATPYCLSTLEGQLDRSAKETLSTMDGNILNKKRKRQVN